MNKKQRNEKNAAKRAAFDAELKRSNEAALERDRQRRAREAELSLEAAKRRKTSEATKKLNAIFGTDGSEKVSS